MENTYAQIHCMIKTSKISDNHLDENTSVIQPSGDRLREYFNIRHVSQMRVAIDVMGASLESAFQLVLQLYILGTQYNDLKQLHFGEITLGSILIIITNKGPRNTLVEASYFSFNFSGFIDMVFHSLSQIFKIRIKNSVVITSGVRHIFSGNF
ncbi:UNVERIFIED_CONTAM: hypothetical protein RMT77_013211 [Armadillidium vulgare]